MIVSCQVISSRDQGNPCLDLPGLHCRMKRGHFTDGENRDQLAGEIYLFRFAFNVWWWFLLYFVIQTWAQGLTHLKQAKGA